MSPNPNCGTCGQPKTKRKSGSRGEYAGAYCRNCQKVQHYAWKRAHPVRHRVKHYRFWSRKIGVPIEEIVQAILRQQGLCAICGVKMANPHFDHCHTTGVFRGFLCTNCNTGLGMFKDDPALLEKAIKYVAITRAKKELHWH